MTVVDAKERLQALDIHQSFIVQAPAGSGKTELLTQRFLALLANVQQAPEEIVAITFTRKAAAEMRTRIFESIRTAEEEEPSSEHKKQTWQLARQVLLRNNTAGWNLLQNPNRLRILTIDALCAKLTKAAPILSQFGTVPAVVDDATNYYARAAQSLLASLEENSHWSPALATLLLHLDNNYQLAENLFIGMLSRRDQWLAHIINHQSLDDARQVLEQGLLNIVTDCLQTTANLFSADEKQELLTLTNYAAANLKQLNNQSRITACSQLMTFPAGNITDLPIWQGIAELLLTTAGEWRKAVNKKCGFPAVSEAINDEQEMVFKHMKERMTQLLSHFNTKNTLQQALKNILLLPPPIYSSNQWQIVAILIHILPILVAHLHLIFQEENKVDFIAIAEGAVHALGENDNPTELALNVDYQIRHLLVDEFQDTSLTQYRLLELLTAGWEKQDGRTLFLVGDPMQSIYRFREAEVGIFLTVKKHGLNQIKLTPLNLKVNFRSQPGVVNWFNQTFQEIFPGQENTELGAISFSPSVSFSENQQGLVKTHTLSDNTEEARYIATLIKTEMKQNAEKSIAILVRSRNHLQTIIPELKKENIAFEAIEIEKLLYSPAVSDLLALTKAIIHPNDSIAWLSILRAPWGGLTLHDLYFIAKANHSIWDAIKQFHLITELSEEGKQRLARIVPILTHAMNRRSRGYLRQEIAYVWYALGGPACLTEAHEIKNTDAYLQLVEKLSETGAFDINQLEKKLIQSYSHHTTHNAKVHLMTIHKAKGLEFDIVILPSLEKRPAVDENRLLIWLERSNQYGNNDLILAPIKPLDQDYDPIYRYIRRQQTQKSEFEVTRLLYVAVTRAREIVHLVGSIVEDTANHTYKNPPSGSFLHLFWPLLKNDFIATITKTQTETDNDDEYSPMLSKLSLDWQPPDWLPNYQKNTIGNYRFEWTPHYLDHVGKVVHEYLDKLSQQQLDTSITHYLQDESNIWRKKLLQYGVPPHELDTCLQLVSTAIQKTLLDPRGQWILANHLEANSEYPITMASETEIIHYFVDRTFIDTDGFRWIIDYKTTDLAAENNTKLLTTARARYALQLENYAKAFKLLEDRPIKIGIYFPLFSGWCQWNYEEQHG